MQRSWVLQFAASLLFASVADGKEAHKPVRVVVGVDQAGACTRTVDDQPLTDEQMIDYIRHRRGMRKVQLSGLALDVPWTCVGSTIYELQRARVRLKVGFISEPPPQ